MFSNSTPPELSHELWQIIFAQTNHNYAMAVSGDWYTDVNRGKWERFRYLFPDLYSRYPSGYESVSSWSNELYAQLRQVSWVFSSDELNDYLRLRRLDIDCVNECLHSEKKVAMLYKKDGAGKQFIQYLADSTQLEARQTIFDILFQALSKHLLGMNQQYNKGIFYHHKKDLIHSADLLIGFATITDLPLLLLLAVICNQTKFISEFTICDEQRFALFDLALQLQHETLALILLDNHIELLFHNITLQNARAPWNYSASFVNALMDRLTKADLSKDPLKRTLLQWAVIFNHEQYIKAETNLQSCAASINQDKTIDFVCRHDISLYQLLKNNQVNFTLNNYLFINTAACGNVWLLKELINNPNIASQQNKQNALREASSAGHLNCVSLLLLSKNGAVLDQHAVNVAIKEQQLHVIQFFSKRPEWKNLIKTVPFDALKSLVLKQDNIYLLEFLYDKGCQFDITQPLSEKNLLHILAEKLLPHYNIIKWLVKHGVMINSYDYKKCTPLTYAFRNLQAQHSQQHLPLIETFLFEGADPDAFIGHSQGNRFMNVKYNKHPEQRRVKNELDHLSANQQDYQAFLKLLEEAKKLPKLEKRV